MSNGWAPYLDPGERLLWEGRPSTWPFLFRPIDILLVPFSVVWCGGTVVFVVAALADGSVLIVLFSLLFLALGTYLVVGRFLVDAHLRRHTAYAVTSKRALIVRSGMSRRLRDMPITASTPISANPGRRGSVTFGPVPLGLLGHLVGWNLWSGQDANFTFRAIDDADQVYKLVRQVQRGDT